MGVEVTEEDLAGFFAVVLPLLDERQQRLVGAAAVDLFGRGGQRRVAEASGLARNTLMTGAKELAGGAGPSPRVRRPGAGRKRKIDLDPDLLVLLGCPENMVMACGGREVTNGVTKIKVQK